MRHAPKGPFLAAALLAALLGGPGARASECLGDVLHFVAHRGSPHEGRAEWGLPPGSEVRHLSDGAKNVSHAGNYGQSYLVRTPGEVPYVLKTYKDPLRMKRDLLGLEFLGRLPAGGTRFKVARAERGLNDSTMRLSYAEGRDFSLLIRDTGLSPVLRERLLDLYHARIRQLVEDVTRAEPRVEPLHYKWDTIDTVVFNLPDAGDGSPRVSLNITPAQVIVDPRTLEMTIVDPY